MAKTLIIVESPAKTKTLKGFLGSGYQVAASMGHVRDLPERSFGVDIENGFSVTYRTIPSRRDQLKQLQTACGQADRVYLASDPDREGEAIAYHLATALKLKDAERIEFNEITRTAVQTALQNPRPIDARRVEAQEARRVLDRIVGYKLSPLLWRRVRRGLSAGRVQSVVLRLICEREREIQAFIPEEYWSLTATLSPQAPNKPFPFEAKLVAIRDESTSQRKRSSAGDRLLKTQADADAVLKELEGATYRVASLTQKEQRRNPQAPFTTSTLQQEAARKLGFSNRRTMSAAQQLYEGVELGAQGSVGLITYMRSDSVRIAAEAQAEARDFITATYGATYLPRTAPKYKTKGPAQDAHEAIRPTSVARTPESVEVFLSSDQKRLYRLIWQRLVASQMAPAVFDVTTADVTASRCTFRATGAVRKFDGFMRIYTEGKDTAEKSDEEQDPLPPLTVEQMLDLIKLEPLQHFTEPPPRYTEATLVKVLDEKGIGRPSTWASFIAIIQERGYVDLIERRFVPTELGFMVNDYLVARFPVVMDLGFTKDMEIQLDEIEEGKAERTTILEGFYTEFERALEEAYRTDGGPKPKPVETEFKCPKCERPMLLRQSDRGPFLGCSGYPRCKTVLNPDGTEPERPQKPEQVVSDQVCPKCGKPMIERTGKYGKFLGCSGFPKCRTIVKIEGEEGESGRPPAERTGVACPKDGGDIVVKRSRRGKVFYGCANYPTCTFSMWDKPTGQVCPTCGWPLAARTWRGKPTGKVKCSQEGCGYEGQGEADVPPDALDGS